MCKCCQSCLESCYWHCFEKWWCYDESIAMYEEPMSQEKDHRAFDNLAFWDSVSVIANRSVVTIQPLPERATTKQPQSNANLYQPFIKNITSIPADNNNIDKEIQKQSNTNNDEERTPDAVDFQREKLRKKSAVEEKIEKRSGSISQEKNRKKSLKERRKSAAGLTLKLDNDFHEIPVIRQSSMPRFFIETPNVDKLHGNYNPERSSVLMSPVLGNSPTFNYDLKSIVQIERECAASQSKPSTPKSNRTSRLTQVRRKLKPSLIKKPSAKSLPDSINHM